MKKFKIIYNKGNDILVNYVEAKNKIEAIRQFYMIDVLRDIISIEEVPNERLYN